MTTLVTDGTMDVMPLADADLSASPYASSLEQVAPGITSLVDQSQQPGETWVDSLARMLPVLATTYQQKQILDIQIERARMGLPPLNASQYGLGVSVGLSNDAKNMLLLGAAAIGVVLLLRARRRN